MRRLWLFTCLAGALGCQCGDPDEALKVVVKIDPAQRATCAVLEISDGSGVRFTQDLVRVAGKDELVVGLKQGDLPRTIGLKARGLISAAGCDSPRTFNGDSGDLSATFPDQGVQTVEVPLPPPPAANDVDRDGFVARAFGGLDCDDNDSAVRPGVPQVCGSSTDQDCDDAVGCADTECSPTAFCQRTPDRLVFVTAPVTVDARACSPALTVETQDAQGVVPARQGLPVALSASPSTGVTFFSDAACSTAATTVTILQGQTRGTFYFRATQGGTTFTASAAVIGLTPASQLETVTHPVPTQLAFTTPPRTAAANACSQAMTVELRDSSGTATQVGGAVLVTVTGNPATGLQLFSDSACTALLSGGAFNLAGASTGTFYARSTRAGTAQLTAAATALASAQQPFNVTPLAATALNLVGSGQGIATATCSSAVTVQTEDLYGNASPVSAATVVGLASAPTGGGFLFYSDAGCTSAVNQVTIAAGAASAQFYFKGATAGTYTVTASSSVGNDTQPEVIGVGPPAKLVITTAVQSAVVAGTCSGIFTVQSRDVSDNPSNITGSALAVALATNPSTTGLQFFSDATCTTSITGASIAVGATTASLYFKSTTAGPVTILVSSPLPTGDSQTETIVPTTATVLRFTNSAFTVAANSCAGPFRVETRDQYGNVSNVFSNTVVNLSSNPAGVTFFTAAGCGTSTTQVTIAANSASATFYARATVAAAYSVAAAGGVGSDSQTFTVTPGAATKLVFQPLAQTLTAGACSAAMAVQRQDQFNNPVTAGGALTVALTSDATSGFAFYGAAGCGGATVTGVDIPNNGSSATLYLRGTVAEVVTVTGAGGGLTNATHTATINPDTAVRLVFTPAAQTVTAGVCSVQVAVQRQDQFNNPVTVGGLLTVTLGSDATGGLTFHTAAGCGSPAVTTVDIAASGSTATFYLRATRVEAVTVSGAGGGLAPASHVLTINPAAVSKLVFSPLSQTVAAGACTLVGVERQDQFGNPISSGGALAVNLSSDASSGLIFSSASNCGVGTDITQVSIAAGTSTATFYVRATVAEVVTVTGAGGSLADATHTLTVTPAAATKLVFSPTSQTATAGACGAVVTVQRQDQFGNAVTTGGPLTVTLSSNASSGLTFHNAGSCALGTTEITQVSIASNGSSATFYIRGTIAEAVTVTGAGGSLTDATLALTINAAGATKLVFSPLSQALTAGVCGAIVSVERQDQFGNAVTAGGALTVSLSSNATASYTFHNASSCGGGTAITQVSIAASTSRMTFYMRGQVAQPVTVTGAGGTLADATMNVTVNPAAASKLVYTVAPVSALQSVCSTIFTVQQQDSFNNPVPVGADTPVTLSHDTTGLQFFTAAGCGGTATGTVTMASGASTVSFYVRGADLDATIVLTASVGGAVTDATTSFAVNSAANKLVFTSAAQTLPAATCSPQLTVQRQDGAGNPVTSGGSLQVNLSSNATSNATGGLLFYSDASCATPATFVTISPGTSSANFYVKAHVAETATLTGQGGTLLDATQPYVTTLGPAAKLRFTSPGPQTIAALACSAQITVRLEDAGGNAVNAGGAGRTITFSGTGGTVTTFWTNAACSTAMAGNTLLMGAASSTVTLYFKAENGPTTTLTAASTVPTTITSGTEVETLTPAVPTQLVFTTAPTQVEAGFCLPVTLERQDQLNRPTAPATATDVTDITVSAPQTGLLPTLLFSDPFCGTPLGFPTTIAAGASSTVVYVKGRSGDVSGSVTASHAYTLTSVSALTDDTLVVTVLPMVRRGSCTLATATTNPPCAITPALTDISRTMLLFQASANTGNSGDAQFVMATCRLQLNGVSGDAEVACDRAADGVDMTIAWQTVSFAYSAATSGGASVQHLSTGMNYGTTNSFQNIAIASSPMASSFVLFSYRDGSGSIPNGNEFFMAELRSDISVRMSYGSDGNLSNESAGNVFETQVVNWSGANVARGITAGGNTTLFTASQATPNPGRTFLLHSARMASVGETGAPEMCGRTLSGGIDAGTGTLVFERGCNNSGHDIGDISWERVELPPNASVQHLTVGITNTNSGNQAITAVDRTRAFVFIGGQLAGGTAIGRTNHTGGELGCAQARASFTANNSIRLDRMFNCGNSAPSSVSTWGVFVVEVTP